MDKNNIQEQVAYSYNSHSLLSSQTITNSNGLVHKQEMKYPSDFQTSLYPAMVTKNILSPVVEAYNYKSNSLIEKTTQDYALQHSLFYAPINSKYQKGSSGNLEVRETYQYDTKGNVREVITNSADKTVYLWGYNYRYPIAKIENASFSNVTAVVSETSLNNIAVKNQPSDADWNTIAGLRTSLSNALVTIYKYSPLVGMTEMINPQGVKTTYVYDSFGRLQTVKDNNNNVLENYGYHYRP